MRNIFFTSDTHYNHKNIVRGTTEWKQENNPYPVDRTRDFNTLEEHNTELVKSINSIVKPDDILYHLGDWSFGGHENIKKFREQLHCKEIHLIFGNHDQHIEKAGSPYRELFTSTQHYLELNLRIDSMKSGQYGKTKICLSHFAHRIWNKAHHGAIHLYGHSHGTIEDFGRSMDVGVDTNNLYPYHLDEILEIMKNRKTPVVDHHNENTN